MTSQDLNTQELLSSLSTHQIELRIQNEELLSAQFELSVSKAHYKELFDLAPVAYVILSPGGLILDINLAAEKMFGLPKSTLKMSAICRRIHPEDRQKFYLYQEQLTQIGASPVLDLRILSWDQSILPVRMNISFDGPKKKESMVYRLLINDSTGQLKAEAADQAKSDFLSCMSHEMRTPLGVILGYIELLYNSKGAVLDLKLIAEILRTNSQHLLKLINDILDLSKVDSGVLEIELAPIESRSFLVRLKETFEQQITAKGLEFNIKMDGKIPAVFYSDEFRLHQILINIVGNAVKFTARGSINITVSISDVLIFTVSDSGCGIPEEKQNLIFELFMQANGSVARSYGGTGLGLCLAKKTAMALGGDVILKKSELSQGSVFEIRLNPGDLRDVHWISIEDVVCPAFEQDTVQVKQETRLRGARILIIDDFEDNRDLVRLILEQEGAYVDVAAGAAEGIEKAFHNFYHLLLLDIQMPVMDGYEAASVLRSKNYEQPILALTAHAMKGIREKCLSAGYNDYLTKPVIAEQLIETIMKYLPKNFRIISTLSKENPVYPKVPEYIVKLSGYVEQLQHYISQNEWGNLGRLAHQLTGTNALYGFGIITPLCHDLEQAAQEESPSLKKIVSIFNELNSITQRIALVS